MLAGLADHCNISLMFSIVTDPRPNPSLGPAFTLPIHTDGKTLKLNFMLEASTSLQQLSPRQYEPNPEAEETRTIMALPLHARIYLDGLVESKLEYTHSERHFTYNFALQFVTRTRQGKPKSSLVRHIGK